MARSCAPSGARARHGGKRQGAAAGSSRPGKLAKAAAGQATAPPRCLGQPEGAAGLGASAAEVAPLEAAAVVPVAPAAEDAPALEKPKGLDTKAPFPHP